MELEKDKLNKLLKVDLDIKTKSKTIKHLKDRLKQMDFLRVLPYEFIEKVILIKKTNHSCKIYLKHKLTNENILHLQAMLGDDPKRQIIGFRDLIGENSSKWNKMFDIKRYMDGSYKEAEYIDVTTIILKQYLNRLKDQEKNKNAL